MLAFFARHLAGLVLENALREVVHFRGERVRLGEFERLAVAARPAVAGVVERRIHSEPAVLGERAEVAVGSGVVARAAVADDTAWKFGLPDDRLLDLRESRRIALRRRTRDPDRLLARQVASGLQGIDAYI